MALLEAEADAIMQFVSRRREGSTRYQPAVEINIQDSGEVGENEADTPHVPPVHGSVGVADQEEDVVAQAEAEPSQENTEAPMETDKPGIVSLSTSFCEQCFLIEVF